MVRAATPISRPRREPPAGEAPAQAERRRSDRGRRWVRAALVYLTVTFLTVGVWATLAPRSFYDGFPGGGRNWIAGDGPYNAHLVSDTGVGFLAVGAVLLLAAVWMERRLVQAASVAVLVHAVPHLVFHLRHPHEALTSLDSALSNGGLALSAALAFILLVAVSRAAVGPGDSVRAGVPSA